MSFTKRIKAGLSAVTVLFIATLTASAFAEGPTPIDTAQCQVADQLTNFKASAYALRHDADALGSPANTRVTWQTQSRHLAKVRDRVNQLGKSLAELEALKPTASDSQKLAIEHSRGHLVSIAQDTTRAIELINHNRSSVHFTDYTQTVRSIQDHAASLHTKLDTILDFENARERLDALDLQPMLTEGS